MRVRIRSILANSQTIQEMELLILHVECDTRCGCPGHCQWHAAVHPVLNKRYLRLSNRSFIVVHHTGKFFVLVAHENNTFFLFWKGVFPGYPKKRKKALFLVQELSAVLCAL